MKAKLTPSSVKSCPVPPWNSKTILQLGLYLGLSNVKLAEILKVPRSTLQAWVLGKLKISPKSVSSFKNIEPRLSDLRAKALAKEEKEARNVAEKIPPKMRKPWTVSRIRRFMNTWGMGQIEMSVFAGVSVDTVISWGLGRRKLVRTKISEHISSAEEASEARSFANVSASKIQNRAWSDLLNFCYEKFPPTRRKKLKDLATGEFKIFAYENKPGELSNSKPSDSIIVQSQKRSKTLDVKLKLGKKLYQFQGRIKKVGKISLIELSAETDDPHYFNGRAGCIRYRAKTLHINLWSSANVPIRIIAGL